MDTKATQAAAKPPSPSPKTATIDLERIVDSARKNQWSVDDFDWSTPIQANLTRKQKKRLGQVLLFAAGVERMAVDGFSNHARYVEDNTAKTLFQLNALDEFRHAEAEVAMAKRLGTQWKDLPWTVRWMFKEMHADMRRAVRSPQGRLLHAFASSGILVAELGLDSIFLPMLKQAMNEPFQNEVWRRIDQDEHRHIASDYWLIEHRAARAAKSAAGPSAKSSAPYEKRTTYPFSAPVIAAMIVGMGTMVFLMKDMPFKAKFYQDYWDRLRAVPEKAPHAMENSGYRQTVAMIQRSIDYFEKNKSLAGVLGHMARGGRKPARPAASA